MINYWWVTRPKRKLNSVPEVLAVFAQVALDREWEGQRGQHLGLEEILEENGLKREGDRRDHTGGGGRTYLAWLKSLGLVFIQKSTGKLKLTLAGEAIIAGDSPVSVITNQILKYQFPSSFSIGRGIDLSNRFKIRPFRFLLRLLSDSRVGYLTQDEIAKIVVTEAEDETNRCFEHIVERVKEFRDFGDAALDENFCDMFRSSKGSVDPFDKTVDRLNDVANTIINWLEYTQLVIRDDGKVIIIPERAEDVASVLGNRIPFIDRPEEHEYFQRKYGVDPKHKKDSRNLEQTVTITARMISVAKIRNAYIAESIRTPITSITRKLIEKLAEDTGEDIALVEDVLLMYYPTGSVGAFMTEYFEMAFAGTKRATEFEKATCQIFQDILGFSSKHVGPIGLTPDVLLYSGSCGYQAIIDNKAYSKYTVNNDHHNRMVTNYIGNINNYGIVGKPLAFFTYIAGGFGSKINDQIEDIHVATGISGSAMPVSNMIALVNRHSESPVDHQKIREVFSLNRKILRSDIDNLFN